MDTERTYLGTASFAVVEGLDQKTINYSSGSLPGVIFASREHLAMPRDIHVGIIWMLVLLASSG